MSLLDVLRKGVKIIDKITQPLQCLVTLERYIADDDGYGPGFLPPVQLHAIVDWRQKQVRTMSGVLSVSRALIMFVDIDELNAATAGQGINDSDIITLPDGTTGPILDMAGFIDAGTGQPLATEVFIG
jgi:hypothetical protein